MTMRVLKRVLSLFIVGLFVFTALAVIQSGGTNTASIHSVSPTSVLPYTTTSNGLIYTVESNGTYLWNGHYLRDPPVAYPTVPTIAPDGLPYGAVYSGTRGHVGIYHFTRGTPGIVGVSPASTTGAATTINTNTSWNNETLTIVGNVTVSQGYHLYVNDTTIIFKEPVNTTWDYAIYSKYNDSLFVQDGSVIEGYDANEVPWGIYAGYGIYPKGHDIFINNTTILDNTTSPDKVCGGIYSNVIGTSMGDNAVVFRNDNITYSSLSVDGSKTVLYGLFYSSNISYAPTAGYYYNDILYKTGFGASKSSDMCYDTIDGATNIGSYGSTVNTNAKGEYAGANNTLIENINTSLGTVYLTVSPVGRTYAVNDTLINFTDPYEGGTWNTGYGSLINGHYYANLSLIHDTFANWHFGDPVGNTTQHIYSAPFCSISSQGNIMEYSKWDGMYANQTANSATNDNVLFVFFGNATVTNNILENIHSRLLYNRCNAFSLRNQGSQIYGLVATRYAYNTATFSNNYIYNLSGQVWAAQLEDLQGKSGTKNMFVNNNTVLNVNHSQGIGLEATPTGPFNGPIVVQNNSAYNVFNYSLGIGSSGGGSGIEYYYNNHGYNIGINSYAFDTESGNPAYFNDINTNSIILINANYTTVTSLIASTNVFIDNSSLSDVYLSQYTGLNLNTTTVVTPSDFNITLYNSYVPAKWFVRYDQNYSENTSINPFSFSSGSAWKLYGTNPYFLNLTGYLGIFSGQTYTLNASNIKNEASLPIYYSGNEIADIPASSAHYNFTAISQSEYSISTTSAASPSVSLYFHGIPGLRYVVSIINKGGLFKSFIENATSAGILNATFDPATMPLDPTFEVSPYVAPPPPYNPVQPNPPMNFFPAYVFYILLATSAAGVAAGIYIMIRRR